MVELGSKYFGQLALMLVINRSEVELRKGLRVVELGSFES